MQLSKVFVKGKITDIFKRKEKENKSIQLFEDTKIFNKRYLEIDNK